ncbi:MAG: ABC transporter permease [Chloroflexi bacterium]|nr:ABC transporter permease [Chloroflexota bacterium]
MLKYLLRRVVWLAAVLLSVAAITFALMHLVPGGPWDQEKKLAPQVVENLNRKYGLDTPLANQFASFLGNALRGNLGVSYHDDRGVTEIILQGLPKSAALGLIAFALALAAGIPLGILAAAKHDTLADHAAAVFSSLFGSVPGFALGIGMIILFAVTLHWFPTGGWGTFGQLVLPSLALAALPAAYISRVTRASLLDVLRQDYARTARAKGLSESVIMVRHLLPNALIPVLTITGPELAALVTGSFIIEHLFRIPGVGGLFVNGVLARDYGLIMGSVLFYATAIAVLNLVVDILYAAVDPRVRYG